MVRPMARPSRRWAQAAAHFSVPAAAAAAGAVGGSLLLGSIRSMMGGSHHSFGDTAGIGNKAGHPKCVERSIRQRMARDRPASTTSVPRHIAPMTIRARDCSNTASKNDDQGDHDDMDLDSDDFGGDGDSELRLTTIGRHPTGFG